MNGITAFFRVVWCLLLLLCVDAAGGVALANNNQPDPAVRVQLQREYIHEWGTRETAARIGPEARIALSQELRQGVRRLLASRVPHAMDEAEAYAELSELDQQRVMLLCEKAFEWGNRDIEGFAEAARALELMEKLDADRRLDCLIRLESLYRRAYQDNPRQNLGIGRGFADVNLQLAEERLWRLMDQLHPAIFDVQTFRSELSLARRDIATALSVCNTVLSRARQYARHPGITEAQREALTTFIRSLEDIHAETVREQQRVDGIWGRWNQQQRALIDQHAAVSAEPDDRKPKVVLIELLGGVLGLNAQQADAVTVKVLGEPEDEPRVAQLPHPDTRSNPTQNPPASGSGTQGTDTQTGSKPDTSREGSQNNPDAGPGGEAQQPQVEDVPPPPPPRRNRPPRQNAPLTDNGTLDDLRPQPQRNRPSIFDFGHN